MPQAPAPDSLKPPTSLLERLRKQRAEQLASRTLTLSVPGWSGMVHVRYHPVPWEEMYALLSVDAEGSAQATLTGNTDALIAACDAILVSEEAGEEPVPLAEVLRGQGESVPGEVKFDDRLCEVLALEASTARETVLALFSGAISPELAIANHAARLGAWMQSATGEVDDSLLGG